jgi:CRP/FNR family transcriptional regulator, anaerobic regulatory protein
MLELESLGPFRDLGESGRTLLRQAIVYQDCLPLVPILQKGAPIAAAYFVVRGRLRVYSVARDGTETTLHFVAPGETCVFALNSLFNELRYPAWIQAEELTTVALIPGSVFRKLFAQEPVFQNVTVRALSALVFRLMAELDEMRTCKLSQRLSKLLLMRASNDGVLAMTQRQMAAHLGTTREVVARLMRELVATGAVETRRGQTLIRKAAVLAKHVSGNHVAFRGRSEKRPAE